MKNIVFTYFILFSVLFVYSQNTDFMTASGQDSGTFFGSNQMLDGGQFSSLNATITHGNIEIKGTPLLFKDFKNDGVIFLSSGKSYTINNINIDLDNGQFVSEVAKDSIFIFNNVKVAEIKNRLYTQETNKIYEILEKGNNISLLKHISKVLKRQVQDKLTAEMVKWKLQEDYFVKINDNIHPINLKRKDFFKLIQKNKLDNLKVYIKSNRLSPKIEEDLIIILDYYNKM